MGGRYEGRVPNHTDTPSAPPAPAVAGEWHEAAPLPFTAEPPVHGWRPYSSSSASTRAGADSVFHLAGSATIFAFDGI